MALINIKFASEVLGMNTDVNVIVPQRSTQGQIGLDNNVKAGAYKTLLLLHGASDDNTTWLRRSSIERYAAKYGIAVIMPGADKSFYTDMKYGGRFYTYISEEIPRIVREFLPLSDKREDNFVAGLSMGGYGALKIAMKNPERYAAVAGLSSVADIRAFMTEYAPDLDRCIFGEDGAPDEEDLFHIARECNKNPLKPRVYMGVGLQDFLYEDNVALRDLFKTLDFDFTYRESEGEHGWYFWDEYIQYVLAWMFD